MKKYKVEQKGKRTHGHGNSVAMAEGRGIRELNDNGKNTIKKFKKWRL